MICPQCNGEMSKKWRPERVSKIAMGSAVVWACGVCGRQLTRAEMKLLAKDRQELAAERHS
jgi:hypothetical protein